MVRRWWLCFFFSAPVVCTEWTSLDFVQFANWEKKFRFIRLGGEAEIPCPALLFFFPPLGRVSVLYICRAVNAFSLCLKKQNTLVAVFSFFLQPCTMALVYRLSVGQNLLSFLQKYCPHVEGERKERENVHRARPRFSCRPTPSGPFLFAPTSSSVLVENGLNSGCLCPQGFHN